MTNRYDYLIVGSGLFGATFAWHAKRAGKRCVVIDKRPQLGGNLFCEKVSGINVHKYGPHIFHTDNGDVWQLVNSIVPFNRFTNSPLANYQGRLYNLPFNMNTFHQMWGVLTPAEAKARIDQQRADVEYRETRCRRAHQAEQGRQDQLRAQGAQHRKPRFSQPDIPCPRPSL